MQPVPVSVNIYFTTINLYYLFTVSLPYYNVSFTKSREESVLCCISRTLYSTWHTDDTQPLLSDVQSFDDVHADTVLSLMWVVLVLFKGKDTKPHIRVITQARGGAGVWSQASDFRRDAVRPWYAASLVMQAPAQRAHLLQGAPLGLVLTARPVQSRCYSYLLNEMTSEWINELGSRAHCDGALWRILLEEVGAWWVNWVFVTTHKFHFFNIVFFPLWLELVLSRQWHCDSLALTTFLPFYHTTPAPSVLKSQDMRLTEPQVYSHEPCSITWRITS